MNGRANADAAQTTQVDQQGVPYACLKQNDVNLTSPPLPVTCTDAAHGISSAFANTWFLIDPLHPADGDDVPDAADRVLVPERGAERSRAAWWLHA